MHMLENFLHNMWWCFLSLEQPDENAKPERLRLKQQEATSENTHRTGPETACHSSRMTTALIMPAILKCFAVSCPFISFDAKHVQLLVAETPKCPAETHASQRTRVCEPRIFASLYEQHQSEKIIVLFWEHRGNETWKNTLNRQRLDNIIAMNKKKAGNGRQVQ